MANEVIYSGLGDLRYATILGQEIQLLIADRANLWGHSAIVFYGDAGASGSAAFDVLLAGLDGSDVMAAANTDEVTAIANTALTDASPAITVARQALAYQMSDLASSTDASGLTPERLAASMVGSAAMRFTEMIAALPENFSSQVGTTTVDMSVDDFFDAQFTLTQASVPGPYLALLYPVQLTDLQNSIRAEAGALQFIAATQELLSIKGPGFAGTFNGVDIFASSKVPQHSSTVDSAGGMWGRGAVGYREMSVSLAPGHAGLQSLRGPVMVEFERDAAGGLTKIVGNYYVGVAEIEDSRGVGIKTDR